MQIFFRRNPKWHCNAHHLPYNWYLQMNNMHPTFMLCKKHFYLMHISQTQDLVPPLKAYRWQMIRQSDFMDSLNINICESASAASINVISKLFSTGCDSNWDIGEWNLPSAHVVFRWNINHLFIIISRRDDANHRHTLRRFISDKVWHQLEQMHHMGLLAATRLGFYANTSCH